MLKDGELMGFKWLLG